MTLPEPTTDDPCEWSSCQEPATLTSRLELKCRRWCENHSFTFALENPKAQWATDQAEREANAWAREFWRKLFENMKE